MRRRLLRAIGAVCTALSVPVFTGCSLILIPSSDDPAFLVAQVHDLAFEDGADLRAGSVRFRWTDDLARRDDFVAVEPHHAGGRGYRDADAGCTVTQWESMLTDVSGFYDDVALSERLLSMELDTDLDELQEFLWTDMLPLVGAGAVDVRGTWGEDATTGTSWLMVARGIARVEAGLATTIDCDGDVAAYDFYEELRDDGLAVQTLPA